MQNSQLTTPSLPELEAIIERSVQTFIEGGRAMQIIRDQKLYLASHPTFEAYCESRWGFSVRHASRMITSVITVGEIEAEESKNSVFATENATNGPMGPKLLPENERQTRPLATLETPAEKSAAWNDAVASAPVKNGKPIVTAAIVKKSVEKEKAKRPAPPVKALVKLAPELKPEPIADPAKPWAEFERQVGEIIATLDGAEAAMKRVLKYSRKAGMMLEERWAGGLSAGGTIGVVQALITTLKDGMPYSIDPQPPYGIITVGYHKRQIDREAK